MTIFIGSLHVISCVILILVVLLQSGKAADLAGAFGGGGSQTAFGARGAQTFMAKATTGAAVIFMCTSLGLGILASRQSDSIFEDLPATTPEGVPAAVPPAGDPPALLPTDEPGDLPVDDAGDGSETGAPADTGTDTATKGDS